MKPYPSISCLHRVNEIFQKCLMANYDAIYQDALDPKPMQVLLNLSNNQKLVLVKMPIALIFNFKLILLLYLMLDLVLIGIYR